MVLCEPDPWAGRDGGARAPANTAPTIAQAIVVNNKAAITGKTASLSVLGKDDGGETKLVYQWSVTAAPAGGGATFSLNGTNAAKKTTVTFTKAGIYNLTVRIVDAGGLSVSSTAKGVVTATLASIAVSPGAPRVVAGATQQFAAAALDQFGQLMASQPKLTWSTTGGKITASGLFTAPGSAGTYTVNAKSGSVTGKATVTVVANPGPSPSAALAQLVQSLDADGSISRLDMIQILRQRGDRRRGRRRGVR